MFLASTKNRLSNSTIKQIKAQFPVDLSLFFTKEDVFESIKTADKITYIFRNGVPVFRADGDAYIPTVKCVHMAPEILKKVIVDKGAIKHLINGADVMAPGLLHSTSEYPLVSVGDLVAIYGYDKVSALGVGMVEMDNDQLEEQRTGVAIKMLSHLGDKIYSYAG
ncbi:malignant T-cell-amplified sequence [Nematocida minor]|uniref:malignant T-cell-amplified sequence n=1 Tax=Nematocida minor TaxID=1912983 RepID=UPI002220901E|nr:malignant T-cell-amplified sequence [Nematocida minor]KAI5189211.1 malignant T-cell-amplified sequence [Nematocida minor]